MRKCSAMFIALWIGALILTACQWLPGAQTVAPTTEAPAVEVTEEPVVETTVAPTEQVTEEPTAGTTEAPTEPVTEEPPAETATTVPDEEPPEEPLAPAGDKPGLSFTELPYEVDQFVIGFAFPDGTVALKAAAVADPEQSDEFEVVGVVEFAESDEGPSEIAPGVYSVQIDLSDDQPDDDVSGRLVSMNGEVFATQFVRSRQILNPEKGEQYQPPRVSVGITAQNVCFTLVQDEDNYWRYCEAPGSVLSVQDNYPSLYEDLQELIIETANDLVPTYLPSMDVVAVDFALSEMESPENIEACPAEGKDCAAEIAGAPVLTFWEDYFARLGESPSQPFPVVAGVMRVIREVTISASERIVPGSYVVVFWFNPDGTIFAATISGETDGDDPVTGMVIPVSAATFIDEKNPEEITSQISAWRLFNSCCLWQNNCP